MSSGSHFALLCFNCEGLIGCPIFQAETCFWKLQSIWCKTGGDKKQRITLLFGWKIFSTEKFFQKMFSEENIFPCLVVVKRKWRWRWRWWGGSDGNSDGDGGGESDGSVVTLVRFSIENVVPLLTVENNFCPYRLFFLV